MGKQHAEIAAARLTVRRDGAGDVMVLSVVAEEGAMVNTDAIASTLREVTKLGGAVEVADDLPNDGKVISDERDYEG